MPGEAVVNTSHFEDYSYIADRAHLSDVPGAVDGVWIQGGRIYYCYRDYSSTDEGIFVVSQTADGRDVRQTKLLSDAGYLIHGFSVSGEDRFMMLLSKQYVSGTSIEFSIIYCIFDYDGNELSRVDITELLPHSTGISDILQAVFTGEDSIVITIRDTRGIRLFIIDTVSGTAEETQLGMTENNNTLAALNDERIIALNIEQGEALLREINFTSRRFGEAYPIAGDSESHIFPAGSNTHYDLLFSARDYLYGYITETREQTILLSWSQTGIDRSQIIHIGLTDDGRVLIFTQTGIFMTAQTQLYVLTPILRAEMQEQITITIGGLYISDAILRAVAKYNLENADYHIEVIDYIHAADGNYQAGLTRLLTELITGSGPDILFSGIGSTFAARAHLLDLYTFIDADPELSRNDFFPNILQGLEIADGILPLITQNFKIPTVIGTVETVGHINNWTLPTFFELGEEYRHVPYPFGDNRSKRQFLSQMLMYSYGEFIDMDTYTANFDSESFIKLLDITTFYKEAIDPSLRPAPLDKYLKMLRGEQILVFEILNNVSFFHTHSQVIGDSLFAIGYPTADGGQHIALPGDLLGINAGSLHADAAWSFIRSLLIEQEYKYDPFDIFDGFPLRIDLFNAKVEHAMAPAYEKDGDGNYILDRDGNLRYTFHSKIGTPDGNWIIIYEMTEAAERELRRIIDSARVTLFLSSDELWNIINEEIDTFLNGTRSAEMIARSLQNRVQIYLSEQELLQ